MLEQQRISIISAGRLKECAARKKIVQLICSGFIHCAPNGMLYTHSLPHTNFGIIISIVKDDAVPSSYIIRSIQLDHYYVNENRLPPAEYMENGSAKNRANDKNEMAFIRSPFAM